MVQAVSSIFWLILRVSKGTKNAYLINNSLILGAAQNVCRFSGSGSMGFHLELTHPNAKLKRGLSLLVSVRR